MLTKYASSKEHLFKWIEIIQKRYHKKTTFTEEYLDFLEKFEVPFDERYIFKKVEY